MTQNRFIRQLAWVALVLMVPMLLVWPAASPADQAQYFYDDLGRLAVVVDGNKNVSVYSYDAVGNILSVTQSAQGAGSIGIFFISPTSGAVGTSVTINGFGFSTTPSANAVAFNGTAATVSSSTTNTIQTLVPTGATTGTITVTNTNGTATSPHKTGTDLFYLRWSALSSTFHSPPYLDGNILPKSRVSHRMPRLNCLRIRAHSSTGIAAFTQTA